MEQPKTGEEAPLPPEVAKHLAIGVQSLQENKISDALTEFQQAAQLAPNVPAGHLWLGRAYLSSNKFPEAETELEKVLSLAPKNYYAAMILLGRLCLLNSNRVNEAGGYLQQASKLSPDNVEAHFELGRMYALKGERRKAIRLTPPLWSRIMEYPPEALVWKRLPGASPVVFNHGVSLGGIGCDQCPIFFCRRT